MRIRRCHLKIAAIFSDYDGTLAPEDVPLESSRVPKEIEEPLRALAKSIPVAIVTSKDYAFVRSRTDFASAWACVSGLEIVLPDGRSFAPTRPNDRLKEGLDYIRSHDELGLKLEPKHSTAGDLLAFSVDWRGASKPSSHFMRTATARLTRLDLNVVYDPTRPYFDVFGRRPDKGGAVRELKRLLNIAGNVLFIGDSSADNPAFDEADVAMCVDRGQRLKGVECEFSIRQEGMGLFLRSLIADRLSLDPGALARKSQRV